MKGKTKDDLLKELEEFDSHELRVISRHFFGLEIRLPWKDMPDDKLKEKICKAVQDCGEEINFLDAFEDDEVVYDNKRKGGWLKGNE